MRVTTIQQDRKTVRNSWTKQLFEGFLFIQYILDSIFKFRFSATWYHDKKYILRNSPKWIYFIVRKIDNEIEMSNVFEILSL